MQPVFQRGFFIAAQRIRIIMLSAVDALCGLRGACPAPDAGSLPSSADAIISNQTQVISPPMQAIF